MKTKIDRRGFIVATSAAAIGVASPIRGEESAPSAQASLTAPALTPNPPYARLFAVDPNLKLPYVHEFNAALEQSLGQNQTLSATYVGAVGRRLLTSQNFLNGVPTLVTASRNGGIFGVTFNGATSDYHSLQLQFRRRLSHDLQVLTSYTWQHSIDEVSASGASSSVTGSSSAQNAISDPGLNRASSDFDVRQIFSTAISYNLQTPKNAYAGAVMGHWGTDFIYHYNSPIPINVSLANVLVGSAPASFVVRPNRIRECHCICQGRSVIRVRRPLLPSSTSSNVQVALD